ncbi:MAG TPA: tyrosine-type recombinase/integrase [Thermoanaerobaculia bacterium]|nr:tyrosine-type recombinase/integrase [Thermoanaerobaculia bacterium]
MARREQADYVVLRRDRRFDVSPPIVHPPYCLCALCRDPKRAARRKWEEPIVIRARRASPYPDHRPKSAAYALRLKAELECDLQNAVIEAEKERKALGSVRSVADVCAYYLVWQLKHGKDWERDQYRVVDLERMLGPERAAERITYADYERIVDTLQNGRPLENDERMAPASKATVRRYVNTLIAIFNRAVKARLIASHQLKNIERPKAASTKKPIIFTRRQVAVLLGSAMRRYEQEQVAACQAFEREREERAAARRAPLTRKPPSVVPLRGFCLIAYMTLMRPETNFNLRWEQLVVHPAKHEGRFALGEHKNAEKGVEVDAPLKPELVQYLKSIMPSAKAKGLVHPNPETGAAYENIRTQWLRLVEIANEILATDEQLTGARAHFYTWRHTGASNLAASSKDPVLVTRMMGDTQLQTVMDHYFDSDFEHMRVEVARWEIPTEESLIISYASDAASAPN